MTITHIIMGSVSYIVYSAVDGAYAPHNEVVTYTGYRAFSDPVRNAKIYKALPHLFLPPHEWSIWVDSNVTLNVSPEELLAMTERHVAVFSHWERDCIYQEADAARHRDDEQVIQEQIRRYRDEGYPEHAGLGMCFLIIRKNTEVVRRLNERWWAEICRGSKRDQISFPYVYRNAQYFPKVNYHIPNTYFTRV